MSWTRTVAGMALALGTLLNSVPVRAEPPAPMTGLAARQTGLCTALQSFNDTDILSAIDAAVARAAASGFSGQVALLADGERVHLSAAGTADRRGRIPVTDTTRFHVASIAKLVTASLAVVADRDGILSLDDPVARWIDSEGLLAPETTLNDLLSHRAGLVSTYAAERHRDAGDAVHAILRASQPLLPYGEFRYSNDGYDLAAIVLEHAYSEPFEAVARREVLDPACLEAAAFWSETNPADAAQVSQPLRRIPRHLRNRNYGMIGSGGYLSSARELVVLFDSLFFRGLLEETARDEMTTPRAAMSLGHAVYGGFLIEDERFGRILNYRGAEDRGDNAYLNHYLDCDLTLAIVTSRGPAQRSGEPLFRDQVLADLEPELARYCHRRAAQLP